jgi:acetylornithine deacetylase/succinyl-diaminopimelate desuccinylase-like protein
VAPTTTTTLPAILPTITAEEATAVALNAEVLATVTAEEATQVFDALVLDDLTDTQLEQLVAAVQDAPTEVREAFEEEIDIFSGATDTYVPIGSTVPVKTRRALIAITTVMSVAPAIKRRN